MKTSRQERQLEQLLKGLMVPNIEIWMKQEPETFLMLGAMLAMKGAEAPKEMIEMAQRKLMKIIKDPNAPLIYQIH